MADIWLSGYKRVPLGSAVRGKPYQFTHNPKGCLHTTEGSSIAGARAAYAPYPPHLIYDWRTRQGEQHVPLNYAAYSAMDGNDDDYMIQVEIVGYAKEARYWPEQALRNIAADVIAPLERAFNIPRRAIWKGFKDELDQPMLASPTSSLRISWAELRDFAGWLGHQHLPAPDHHWDPGAIPINKILSFVSQEDDMQPTDRIKLVAPDSPDYSETHPLDWALAAAFFRGSDAYNNVARLMDEFKSVKDELEALRAKVESGAGGTYPGDDHVRSLAVDAVRDDLND